MLVNRWLAGAVVGPLTAALFGVGLWLTTSPTYQVPERCLNLSLDGPSEARKTCAAHYYARGCSARHGSWSAACCARLQQLAAERPDDGEIAELARRYK